MSTELDRAWNQVNSLGGTFEPDDLFNSGYALGLEHALQIIERLGGKDPLVRAAEEREGRVLPFTTLAAMNGDDTPPDQAA